MSKESQAKCPAGHDQNIGKTMGTDRNPIVITLEVHDKICRCSCDWCRRSNIDTEALRLSQGVTELYIFTLSAGQIHNLILSGRMDVDRWSPRNPNGYQRTPSQTRSKKFGTYVAMTSGICPVSLLLSLRDKSAFHLENRDSLDGVVRIRINLDKEKLYIPDGQHRAFGLEWAVGQLPIDCRDYQVPVILLVSDSKDPRYEEAQQFYTINSNAKRIRTDLAQRFLLRREERERGEIRNEGIIPDIPWMQLQPYAVRIADMLNEAGPLSEKIKPPNIATSKASISQTSFTDSTRPLLLVAGEIRWSIVQTANVLKAFWGAVREKCPRAFEHWSSDSCSRGDTDHFNAVLVTTAGMYSLNDVLSRSLMIHDVSANPASKQTFTRLLEKPSIQEYFTDGPEGYWSSAMAGAASHGTSRKSFRQIADDIWYNVVEEADSEPRIRPREELTNPEPDGPETGTANPNLDSSEASRDTGREMVPMLVEAHEDNARKVSSKLRGWALDVWSLVEEFQSEFTLAEAYEFESSLRSIHPENEHIREKIRQQLQVLRDAGLVEFRGNGKYVVKRRTIQDKAGYS